MADSRPDADAVRVHLARVLASRGFAGAGRLSRFLRYVVERTLAGEGDELKEYVVGVEVFDRQEPYDPRLDSIVRVEAGRLRSKLDEYYIGEGADDEIRIGLPRGGYLPSFERRPSRLVVTAPESAATSSTAGAVRREPLTIRSAVLAFGAVTVFSAVIFAGWVAWSTGFARNPPPPIATIAVLPFEHYSMSSAHEQLAARLTAGVTTELARLGTLGVVSHTSAQRYAGTRTSLRDIASTLGADVIVEASVQVDGEAVTVEARLVDARIDRKFRVETFRGGVSSLTDLERRVAAGLTGAVVERHAAGRRD